MTVKSTNVQCIAPSGSFPQNLSSEMENNPMHCAPRKVATCRFLPPGVGAGEAKQQLLSCGAAAEDKRRGAAASGTGGRGGEGGEMGGRRYEKDFNAATVLQCFNPMLKSPLALVSCRWQQPQARRVEDGGISGQARLQW